MIKHARQQNTAYMYSNPKPRNNLGFWHSSSSCHESNLLAELNAVSISSKSSKVELNLVSFKNTPAHVIEMITCFRWLGGANFGRELDTNTSPQLIRVVGIYLIALSQVTEFVPGAVNFSSA